MATTVLGSWQDERLAFPLHSKRLHVAIDCNGEAGDLKANLKREAEFKDSVISLSVKSGKEQLKLGEATLLRGRVLLKIDDEAFMLNVPGLHPRVCGSTFFSACRA